MGEGPFILRGILRKCDNLRGTDKVHVHVSVCTSYIVYGYSGDEGIKLNQERNRNLIVASSRLTCLRPHRKATIENVNTIEERRSKLDRNGVFDCHLSLDWKTLFPAIFDPRSSIVKIVFDCRLSGPLTSTASPHTRRGKIVD